MWGPPDRRAVGETILSPAPDVTARSDAERRVVQKGGSRCGLLSLHSLSLSSSQPCRPSRDAATRKACSICLRSSASSPQTTSFLSVFLQPPLSQLASTPTLPAPTEGTPSLSFPPQFFLVPSLSFSLSLHLRLLCFLSGFTLLGGTCSSD